MLLELLKILGHSHGENKLIKEVKNQNPLKGENGHWKGEKGRQ